MADVELLPLPEPTGNQIVLLGDDFQGDYNFYVSAFTGGQMHAYARANLAPLQAENERLRAEVERLRSINSALCRKSNSYLIDAARWEERAERLAEALRWYAEQAQLCRKFGSEGDGARHALSADGGKRANDALAQEDRNG